MSKPKQILNDPNNSVEEFLSGLLLQFPEPSSFVSDDTGNVEDSGDTEDTNETATETGKSDTSTDTECSDLTDSGCEEPLKSAMELAGENGGYVV